MTSRYPTEKAYGVTTGESAKELRTLGHEVLILSSSPKSSGRIIDQYGNEVLQVKAPIIHAIRKKFDSYKLFGPFIFLVFSIINSYKSRSILKEFSPDVLWTRDAFSTIALLSYINQPKVVIEMHQPPSLISRIAIRRLTSGRNIILLAIRDKYMTILAELFPKCEVLYGPMAVSQEFLKVGEQKLSETRASTHEKPLRVCYVGRGLSSGQDNGLERLLDLWKFVSPNHAKLTILGLSEAEMMHLSERKNQKNVIFSDSISHSDIPEFLKQFDCGIIPYPPNPYNSARFPIKLVEYCATALNVVLTNTDSHVEILGKQIGYFYELDKVESLYRVLSEIRQNPIEARLKAQKGYEWAQRYTYRDRVTPVIKSLEGL